MFEIKSADEVGVFEVSAKFMGVAIEKVELVFQVGAYYFRCAFKKRLKRSGLE